MSILNAPERFYTDKQAIRLMHERGNARLFADGFYDDAFDNEGLVAQPKSVGYAIRAVLAPSNESAFREPIAVQLIKVLKAAWALEDAELVCLLGRSDAHGIHAFDYLDLGSPSTDQKERIRILIDIHARLAALFRDGQAARRWLRGPNAALDGMTPLAVMLHGYMQDIFAIDQLVFQLTGA